MSITRGETLAVVGESGSGKSTLSRAIVGLDNITSGSVTIEGLGDVTGRTDSTAFRRRVQLVFQDPYASLNPRMTLGAIVSEPLRVHDIVARPDRDQRTADLFDLVGLDTRLMHRYPHELSGGQRQRIGLARALALEPELVILDEPVSALDVSVQAQILALLMRLRAELGLSYLFVAHDLALVEQIADRVAVMYLGRIVEVGTVAQVFDDPQHPYTRALIASTPDGARSEYKRVHGEPPSPLKPIIGCAFRSRCPDAIADCGEIDPQLTEVSNGARVACIRADESASPRTLRT